MSPAEQRAAIENNARVVAKKASDEMGRPCTFDRAAVEWLEGHIRMLRGELARVRPERKQDEVDGLGGVLYPFFGECIVRTYGGEWVYVNGEYWGISLLPAANVTLFPQKKVYEALGGDDSESPLHMFDFIAREYVS